MNKYTNLEHEFTLWFNQLENFGLKSERFFDDITHTPSSGHKWMREAFMAGAKVASGTRPQDKKVPALLMKKRTQ